MALLKNISGLLLSLSFSVIGAAAVLAATNVSCYETGDGASLLIEHDAPAYEYATRGDLALTLAYMFGQPEADTDNAPFKDVPAENAALSKAIAFLNAENVMTAHHLGRFTPSDPISYWELVATIERVCANAGEDDVAGVFSEIFGEDFDAFANKNEKVTLGQLQHYMNTLWKLMGLDFVSDAYRSAYYQAVCSPHRENREALSTTLREIRSGDNEYAMLVPVNRKRVTSAFFGTNEDYTRNGDDVAGAGMFVVGQNGTYYYTVTDIIGNIETEEISVSGLINPTTSRSRS